MLRLRLALMSAITIFRFSPLEYRWAGQGRQEPIAPQHGTVRYQGAMPEIRAADIQIAESYSQTRPKAGV